MTVPSLVQATGFLWATGFDDQDTTATVVDRDSFSMVAVCDNGAIDADMRVEDLLASGAIVHCGETLCDDANSDGNGGSDASRKSVRIDVASGERCYYRPCIASDAQCEVAHFPVSIQTASLGFALHIPTDPGGLRETARIVEEDGVGCNVRVNTDGGGEPRLFLYYDTELLASPPLDLKQYACEPANAEDTTSVLVSCSADASGHCPAAADDCSANNTKKREYFPGVEVTQVNVGADNVTCRLKLAGKLIANVVGYDPTSDVDPIATFWIGAPGTEAATLRWQLDDVVFGATDGIGHGWVDALTADNDCVPGASGCPLLVGWNTGSGGNHCGCVESTGEDECVNDYFDACEGPNLYEYATGSYRKTVQHNAVSKIETFTLTNLGALGTMSVRGLHAVALGEGITGGQATFEMQLAGNGLFVSPIVDVQDDTTPRVISSLPVDADGWDAGDVNGQLLTFRTTTGITARVEVHAVVVYVYLQRPSAALPELFSDHNGDGVTTYCTMGNSLTYGTESSSCVGGSASGTQCSQQSFCSWDNPATGGDGDNPTGGCGNNTAESPLNHTFCKSCTGRRSDGPLGAGFPCSNPDDSECACPGGVCTGLCFGGFCTNNEAASCPDGDNDCNLGTCDDTATCIDSCPDLGADRGTCPSAAAYPIALQTLMNTDRQQTFVWAAVTSSRNANCLSAPLNGLGDATTGCNVGAILKGPLGQCRCDEHADCGDASGTCSCTTPGCNGVCTASDTDETACADGFQNPGLGDPGCESGICDFPSACDVLIIQSYLADQWHPGGGTWRHDPDCTEAASFRGTVIGDGQTCSNTLATLCDSDVDCLFPGSHCIGRYVSFKTIHCTSGDDCSIWRHPCRSTADCPFGACTVNEPTHPRQRGFCGCTSDADCDLLSESNTFDCDTNSGEGGVGICRKNCTTDATCSALTGQCEGGVLDCKGVCTYNARMRACTTNADCTATYAEHQDVEAVTFQGECIKVCSFSINTPCTATSDCPATETCDQRCSCMGPDNCAEESVTCPKSRAAWYARTHGHHLALENFDKIVSTIDAWNTANGTTVQVMFITDPFVFDPTSRNRAAPICGDGDFGSLLADQTYRQYVSQHLLANAGPGSRFGHVIPTAEYAHARLWGPESRAVDGTHFKGPGAFLFAEAIARYNNSFTTCAHDKETPWQYPQLYCREQDGDFTSKPCTIDSQFIDCTVTETCELRPCAGSDANCPAAGDTCNGNETW